MCSNNSIRSVATSRYISLFRKIFKRLIQLLMFSSKVLSSIFINLYCKAVIFNLALVCYYSQQPVTIMIFFTFYTYKDLHVITPALPLASDFSVTFFSPSHISILSSTGFKSLANMPLLKAIYLACPSFFAEM